MKRNVQLQALIAVLAAGMMFSSCGNIDIIKRKYRPGFHVDISKKRQKAKDAERSAIVDSRSTKQLKAIEVKEIAAADIDEEIMLTASANETKPLSFEQEKKAKMKDVVRSRNFENMTFGRQMRTIQNQLLGPKPVSGNTHWMAWVSFGTGIGAAAFGLIGFIVAFFGVTLWPLAILLGVAAIVFAILHKKNNYAGERFRKLGLLFGIIGAGLGLLGMIIWIVWAVGGFGGRYWWR